ncbi:MAG: DNA polymerase II large subunit, partial [Candidatus Thorarchaeota archaeon]
MTEDTPKLPAHSIAYGVYFDSLKKEVESIYKVAGKAKIKGVDPSVKVEIPPAHDVAARVEATLDGPEGVAKRIRELQNDMPREEVAFAVAREIALGQLGNITDPEKAADKAVRVALAILTESITAAPLEGISKVRIRGSGSERYLALYLAGPIRAAGGTEAAVTVLVADYVRQVLNLPPFKSNEEEVERALEEVELYARNVHLQYNVYPDLIRFASENLPIMLNGEPTEDFEVSANRDLERIETNRVRSGSVLVLNDGVVGRAAKLAKIVHRLEIGGWEWLDKISEKISKAKSSEAAESDNKLAPKADYLADVIGGRPVFSHPSRIGGFRLRYGRSRNTGLAGVGVHPATMVLVEEFLAPGTHIRTERPGKGSIVAPVDTIEGPIVLLKDGTVRQIRTFDEAMEVQTRVKRIIALGDILVALGEFLENNHPLAPAGYCEEWWSHDLDHACAKIERDELEKKLKKIDISPEELNAFIESPLTRIPSPAEAIHLSKKLKIPLHPRYTYRWLAGSLEDVSTMREYILANQEIIGSDERSLQIPATSSIKAILEKIGIPHTPLKGKKILFSDSPDIVFIQLGKVTKKGQGKDALSYMNSVSDVPLRDRVGFSIGARMGRPEKAEVRRMRPPVQALFPVGRLMGTERNVVRVAQGVAQKADQGTLVFDGSDINGEYIEQVVSQLELELVTRSCPRCQNETFESRCPVCGTHTSVQYWCSQEGCGMYVDEITGMCPRGHDVNLVRGTRFVPIDMDGLLKRVREDINEPESYGLRGVLGLTSDLKIPEYLGKGILRAKHDVYCYRDGTARFDATDAPLTHFTPSEIGVPFHRLRELGYLTDIEGESLLSDDQILELKVQDVVVPENYGDYMVKVGAFVDDCLEKIYGVDRYYNFSDPDDVVGQLVIGLAPHTSAGIIGRVI